MLVILHKPPKYIVTQFNFKIMTRLLCFDEICVLNKNVIDFENFLLPEHFNFFLEVLFFIYGRSNITYIVEEKIYANPKYAIVKAML